MQETVSVTRCNQSIKRGVEEAQKQNAILQMWTQRVWETELKTARCDSAAESPVIQSPRCWAHPHTAFTVNGCSRRQDQRPLLLTRSHSVGISRWAIVASANAYWNSWKSGGEVQFAMKTLVLVVLHSSQRCALQYEMYGIVMLKGNVTALLLLIQQIKF